MELGEEQRSPIEEAMREIECPRAFECYTSGLEHRDSLQDIGANGFLECLQEDSQDCPFSLPFEHPSACLCPVRICIASEFSR